MFDTKNETSASETRSFPDDRGFNEFKVQTEDDIAKYILKSPSTTCPLDPFPTDLLKLCLKETLPVIAILINMCLKNGTLPLSFKQALVIPLLKKKKNQTLISKTSDPYPTSPFFQKCRNELQSIRCQDTVKNWS